MSKTVAKPSKIVAAMLNAAQPIRDLRAGGQHMRNEKNRTLPKRPRETPSDYEDRANNSWLFDGVGKTIKDMSGKVFDPPVALSNDNLPEGMEDWMRNVDLEGQDLSMFCKAVFEQALADGITWIMVEAPPLKPNASKGDVKAQNWRPYLIHIKLGELLGWEFGKDENNAPRLEMARIMEQVKGEPTDDEYEENCVDQVRVLKLEDGKVTITLYQRKDEGKGKTPNENAEWEKVEEEPAVTAMTRIMLFPVYAERCGLWKAEPPLARLAEINMAHWRSQSHQANIMSHARAPMKFFHGYSAEDAEKLVNGEGYAFHSTNENASVGVVEHSGAAIDAGRTELKDMEFQMQAQGLQLVLSKTGNNTATGDVIDEGKSNSQLGVAADGLKDGVENALIGLAEVGGSGEFEPELFVNKDYSANAFAHLDMQALDKMQARGIISKATYIKEAQSRGILSEDVNPEEEIQAAKDESQMDLPDDGLGGDDTQPGNEE